MRKGRIHRRTRQKIPEQELQKFISTIKIDKTFFSLADFCFKHDIPVYILSAGCDYYINVLIKKQIEKYHITLITNRGTYSEKTGLTMSPNLQYPDKNLGISKLDLVTDLQHHGFKVIYCGDGLPDVEPARLADKIFARKTLYQECQKNHLKAEFLNTFQDVKNFIKEQLK